MLRYVLSAALILSCSPASALYNEAKKRVKFGADCSGPVTMVAPSSGRARSRGRRCASGAQTVRCSREIKPNSTFLSLDRSVIYRRYRSSTPDLRLP
jgi:hypothetical protein